MNADTNATENPTQLFFKAAKNMPWVVDIYIAIQAAMAFGCESLLDFNHVANDIMPRPDRCPDSFIGIEKAGLEALGILFDCECVNKGMTDYHDYKFTRKADGKTAIGTIKV